MTANKSYVIGCAVVAALGGLLFGFDMAVISGTTETLAEIYQLDAFWKGFTVAAALIGTIFGSVLVGKPADIFGRRKVLFALAATYFVSAVGSALAWDWFSFVCFRLLGGLAVGGSSVVSPMYTAEISPARLRGRLVAITQFNIVLGVLLAYFSNYLIGRGDFGADPWRWMLGVEAIPAAAFFLLIFAVPESPRWLVARKRIDDARTVLGKLGTDSGNVDSEVAEIQHAIDIEHHSLREPFFQRKYRTPILLAIAIATFNQLSGINAILYYAPEIFKQAGAGDNAARLNSVGIGFMNLIFTMLAMSVIDFFGRKKLMIVGSIGYIVSLGATAWAFYTYGKNFEGVGSAVVLVSLLVFIASHAFGQGAVIWVFLAEIFPNRVRARGQALGSFTHWVFAAAISWTFPIIAEASGAHVFAFYAAMMVLQLLWVLKFMPETKGVPLEKIQEKLGIA
ncbi:MAG: sugar porter family MFS transporter [Phycisphaerae bacterium]